MSSLPSLPELADRHGLTELQARFVEELVACEFNASKAAREAGYSKKVSDQIGYKNLQKPHIQAALAEVTAYLTEQAEIRARDLLEEYRRLAFSDITDVVRWDESGRVSVVPSDELPREVSAAVKTLKWKERLTETGTIRTLEVEFHGKTKPMEKLGQYLGLWKDPDEIRMQIFQVFSRMTPEELKRIEQIDDEELMELIEEHEIFQLAEGL